MIVHINGPFGIGKTTTAREVMRLWPEAVLFDPEEIGAFLRRLLGSLAAVGDYQDLSLWRALTIDLAAAVSNDFGRDLVMPMTIWRRDYLDEVRDGLQARGIQVTSFCLVASRETLVTRIRERSENDGGHAWCLAHVDVGLAAANDPYFGIAIETDGRTPIDIAEDITGRL